MYDFIFSSVVILTLMMQLQGQGERSNFIIHVQECMISDCFLQYRKIDAQIIKGDVFRWKEVLNSSGNLNSGISCISL